MGKTGLVYLPAYLEHDMGMGHPESPNRLRAIVQQLEQSGTMAQLTRIEPRMVEDEWITTVHTAAYLASLKQHSPASGRVSLDPDTSMSPGSLIYDREGQARPQPALPDRKEKARCPEQDPS